MRVVYKQHMRVVYKLSNISGRYDHTVGKAAAVDRANEIDGTWGLNAAALEDRGWAFTRLTPSEVRAIGDIPTERLHSAGPWGCRYGNFGGYELTTEAGWPLRARRKGPAGDRERQANARLIASAPDLLAALRRIANEPCDHGPGFCPRDHARAAIAKAEGRAET